MGWNADNWNTSQWFNIKEANLLSGANFHTIFSFLKGVLLKCGVHTDLLAFIRLILNLNSKFVSFFCKFLSIDGSKGRLYVWRNVSVNTDQNWKMKKTFAQKKMIPRHSAIGSLWRKIVMLIWNYLHSFLTVKRRFCAILKTTILRSVEKTIQVTAHTIFGSGIRLKRKWFVFHVSHKRWMNPSHHSYITVKCALNSKQNVLLNVN